MVKRVWHLISLPQLSSRTLPAAGGKMFLNLPHPTLVLPVAMKRCVASSSCGEIFTRISESESLNKEKSCRFLSRWGTRCFLRLSAMKSQGTDELSQDSCCRNSWQVFPGMHTDRSFEIYEFLLSVSAGAIIALSQGEEGYW